MACSHPGMLNKARGSRPRQRPKLDVTPFLAVRKNERYNSTLEKLLQKSSVQFFLVHSVSYYALPP